MQSFDGEKIAEFFISFTRERAWTTLYKDGTLRLSRRIKASRVGYFHEQINKKYQKYSVFFADSNYVDKSK